MKALFQLAEPVRAALANDPAALLRPEGGGAAWLALALAEAREGAPAVWVTDGPRAQENLLRDVTALAGPDLPAPASFPAREIGAGARQAAGTDLEGERLDCLRRLHEPVPPRLIITCIQALQQKTLDPGALTRSRFTLARGGPLAPAAFAERLAALGYEFETEVVARGQASLRGGILDCWPPHEEEPVRVEFFGDTVESLRVFDPAEQRSIRKCDTVDITPAREFTDGAAGLADHLPDGTRWAWADPPRLREHAHIYVESAAGAGETDADEFDALRARLTGRGFRHVDLHDPADAPAGTTEPGVEPLEGVPDPVAALQHGVFDPDLLETTRVRFVERMCAPAQAGGRVRFFFATDGARDRFVERFLAGAAPPPGVELRLGPLAEGFVANGGAFAAVAEGDLYGRRPDLRGGPRAARRRRLHAAEGARLTDWAGLEPGELVVHVDHGIGRYLGLNEIESGGHRQEVLAVEYAEKARLYIPVGQAHLLSRYTGVGGKPPELHRLGGGRWLRERIAAERAVRDLAADLLEVQARRDTQPGRAFGPDTAWQREFDAAFSFQETEDQLRAIEDVKRDMEQPRPMDRLLCGDVGYGKTEVALRAAFKAVMGGAQVAVLVPTTVLAQQHYDTFCARMAAFPVTVELLSRFRTKAEQAAVVRRLAAGQVDVVIGTHRLVQPDVKFKNLGLVIVDEEQRFGVAHKEAMKALRATVDILTLSATPIPRTLYLGLVGARDLSVIQTAPRERLPIETVVAPYADGLVREAILRELGRGGQVFYLHNRVQTILATRDRLRKLVPEARIAVGHGQMNEHELAEVMHRFVRGEEDVLLCTTIIESGVDIPNVNTILIERADRFGLADLYQLRGRVGRFKRRAYAWLLLPKHGGLSGEARQRIAAIRRHAGLGAGFRLALRDLETRGAGNLLGAEQSGHISAVGFDLYCQLLRRTVAQLRGEAPPAIVEVRVNLDFLDVGPGAAGASIPQKYVEDEAQRLGFYRRLAAAGDEKDLRALSVDLRDRYGPLPPEADRLLRVARLRVRARTRGITSIETDGAKLLLMRGGDYLQPNGRFPRLRAEDPRGKLDEILRWISRL